MSDLHAGLGIDPELPRHHAVELHRGDRVADFIPVERADLFHRLFHHLADDVAVGDVRVHEAVVLVLIEIPLDERLVPRRFHERLPARVAAHVIRIQPHALLGAVLVIRSSQHDVQVAGVDVHLLGLLGDGQPVGVVAEQAEDVGVQGLRL